MQCAGNEFFAGSAFALNEDRRVCVGDLANLLEDILHRGAVANDAGDLTGVGESVFEFPGFSTQTVMIDRFPNLLADQVQVDGFGDQVEGAAPHGIDSGFHRAVSCDDDQRCFRFSFMHE